MSLKYIGYSLSILCLATADVSRCLVPHVFIPSFNDTGCLFNVHFAYSHEIPYASRARRQKSSFTWLSRCAVWMLLSCTVQLNLARIPLIVLQLAYIQVGFSNCEIGFCPGFMDARCELLVLPESPLM
jgi:hypothetical protein